MAIELFYWYSTVNFYHFFLSISGVVDGAVACNIHTFKIKSEPMHELIYIKDPKATTSFATPK